MFSRSCRVLWVVAALLAAGCDRMQLLAPTNSTITVTAPMRVLPTGGNTEITAFVVESSGTSVQNGTTVRFSTTLGRVDPVEAQTRNGFAVATFFAGDASGVAEIRATSGGAGAGSTGTTTPPTTSTPAASTNVVQISVGGAAVDSVTVRGNPAVVSSNGSTVDVIATVVAASGRLLSGIPVSFSATRGTLSRTTAVTDTSGDARVALTTNAETEITATAGGKPPTAARVTAQAGPSVTLGCAVDTTTNCATITQGRSVTFTAQRGTTTSNIRTATLEFGEGSSVDLGSLSGSVTVSHAYSRTGTFTARLIATDVNNETTTATQVVRVDDVVSASVTAQNTSGRSVVSTATVDGGTIVQYEWTFEGTPPPNVTSTSNSVTFTYATAGTKIVSVRAVLSDGRNATASTSVTVP